MLEEVSNAQEYVGAHMQEFNSTRRCNLNGPSERWETPQPPCLDHLDSI